MADTVICVSRHPVDLSTGRPIGPGETADDVDMSDPHNAALLADGHVVVVRTVAAAPKPPEATP